MRSAKCALAAVLVPVLIAGMLVSVSCAGGGTTTSTLTGPPTTMVTIAPAGRPTGGESGVDASTTTTSPPPPAEPTTTTVPAPPAGWGEVLVPGSDWEGANGSGVDVYSNFPSPAAFDQYGDSGYGWRWQSTELVQRYYATIYGFPAHWPGVDYAYQMWGQDANTELHGTGPSDTPFLGGGANAVDYLSILQPGCIVVWDKDTPDRDGAGHVALVTGVDDTHVYVVEQDWSPTGRATLDITASGIDDPRAPGRILGWLTPVFGE